MQYPKPEVDKKVIHVEIQKKTLPIIVLSITMLLGICVAYLSNPQ